MNAQLNPVSRNARATDSVARQRKRAAASHTQFVPAVFARNLLDVLADCGLPISALLRETGLAPADIADNPTGVPLHTYLELHERATRMYGRAGLGLRCSERMRPLHYGLVGFTVRHSRDIEHAVGALNRYSGLLGAVSDQVLIATGQEARLMFLNIKGTGLARRTALEERVGGVYSLLRGASDSQFRLTRLQLPFHADPATYQDFFHGAQIEVGAQTTELRFDVRLLHLPLRFADAAIAAECAARCEMHLARIAGAAGIVAAARHAIAEAMPAHCTEDHVAAALGLKTRTLRRRLSNEDTTFAAVTRAVRREAAESYLRDTSLGMAQIAELLGYADVMNFRRAFRSWTGASPQHFRTTVSRGIQRPATLEYGRTRCDAGPLGPAASSDTQLRPATAASALPPID